VSGSRKSKQNGFTIIEAIVAMVLIATSGMALFSWINSNIITLNRIQEVNAVNAATANALEYVTTINPMANPQGKADLGAYLLEWDATASTETRDGADYPYSISLFQLNLYQTKVTLKKPGGQVWFTFDVQQVGYKKVRELSFGG
jgi:general secretion pathway protein I